jgi:hypothetical protein
MQLHRHEGAGDHGALRDDVIAFGIVAMLAESDGAFASEYGVSRRGDGSNPKISGSFFGEIRFRVRGAKPIHG